MNKLAQRYSETLSTVAGGLLLLLASRIFNVPPYLALLSFMAGVCLLCLAAVDSALALRSAGAVFLRRFKEDKRGIAWVWVTAALALAFTPFVYWAVGWPFDMVVTQITSVYTFTGTMGYALFAVRTLISYLMAFVLFFVVMWSWINSKSPGTV